jgi:conjugal transfer pilus assembly protein TraW
MASDDDFFLKQLAQQNKRFEQALSEQKNLPNWLQSKPATLDATFAATLKKGNLPKSVIAQKHLSKKTGRWIFVSLSMPPEELQQAGIRANDEQAVLVLRGVELGSNIHIQGRKLIEILKPAVKPLPKTLIDPTLFTEHNIQGVPTMVEVNNKQETRLVKGLPGFKWLMEHEPGDQGKMGPTYDILEPDMIDEMKRRIKAVDWNQKKEGAIKNIWNNQTMFQLPVSKAQSTRVLDMSIKLTQDIALPDGRLIAKKGDVVDPQKLLPMKQVFIIFDNTDTQQRELAKKIGDKNRRNNIPVVYLFSNMDKSQGWQAFNGMSDYFAAPVYKLSQSLIDRFGIHALPSVIQGKGDKIEITEYPVATNAKP